MAHGPPGGLPPGLPVVVGMEAQCASMPPSPPRHLSAARGAARRGSPPVTLCVAAFVLTADAASFVPATPMPIGLARPPGDNPC